MGSSVHGLGTTRITAHLDAQFVASIREHGVLMPVLVQRTAEGLHVRAGQRRTLGVIEADRATIPARIVEGDEDQARRILKQLEDCLARWARA